MHLRALDGLFMGTEIRGGAVKKDTFFSRTTQPHEDELLFHIAR